MSFRWGAWVMLTSCFRCSCNWSLRAWNLPGSEQERWREHCFVEVSRAWPCFGRRHYWSDKKRYSQKGKRLEHVCCSSMPSLCLQKTEKITIEISQIIYLLQAQGDRPAWRTGNCQQRFQTAVIKEVSLAFNNQAVTKFGSGGNESTTAQWSFTMRDRTGLVTIKSLTFECFPWWQKDEEAGLSALFGDWYLWFSSSCMSSVGRTAKLSEPPRLLLKLRFIK